MTRLRSPKLNACGGGRVGIPEVVTLDVFATLIDAYEGEHYPIEPPDRKRRFRPIGFLGSCGFSDVRFF